MKQHLLVTVRLHEHGLGTARFHGMSQGGPEWPPAPARVFQALLAGVARGSCLPDDVVSALEWLETLPPPLIASPRRQLGQNVSYFVPNNDADSLADPTDVSAIRVRKVAHPSVFQADQPILYAWSLPAVTDHAAVVARAAEELYQLGRGVDMAWAVAEVVADDTLQARIDAYRGDVHRPERGTRGAKPLACPGVGSLASLVQRHRAPKLRIEGKEKQARVLFSNQPKPRFIGVGYERSRRLVVFELRDETGGMWPWPLKRVVKLVETLRDAAAARLATGLPGQDESIQSTLVGRKPDGRDAVPIELRTRIIPLASIGHMHADRAIRRFALEVPSGAPLAAGDVEWAFSGLEVRTASSGMTSELVATRTDDDEMLRRYAKSSQCWRSVTAVALPEHAKRRRIDPEHQLQQAKGAKERVDEEGRAVAAVHVALRQAGIRGIAVAVRVQREPFEAKGVRAESFAEGTRFAKERLWHVELQFDRLVEGPVLIGDGRFLGLGLMTPMTGAS